jgi:hypothetical protein
VDWKSLLNNRKVQIGGVGVAAAAGGLVYYRRKKSGGSAGAATPADSAATGDGGTAYAPGQFPDTSGTDIAGWLGQYSQGLQAELDQGLAAYTQQQTDFLAALGTSGAPAPTPTPKPPVKTLPKVTPKPGGTVKPTPVPKPAGYVTVAAFKSGNPAWNSTLSGIAGHEHTTVAQLLKLNPSIKNANVIRTGAKIRIK